MKYDESEKPHMICKLIVFINILIFINNQHFWRRILLGLLSN